MSIERPPVIVVLGHVDHGKTTLLDTIRKTSVAEKESGGITQHIGAYEINVQSKRITFIDTPGHEVFVQLRKRGVEAADIALLVVAADDSVQPQTIEALNAVQKTKIPFIVVINKIDLKNAMPERVIKDFAKQGVLFEGRGGDVPYVELSAKIGKNIDTLFELIILLSQMNNLYYDPKADPEGVVVEVDKDKRGIVATIILKNGSLNVGDTIYIEDQKNKVRALFSDKGTQINYIEPSTPAQVLGLKNPVSAGALVSAHPSRRVSGIFEKKEIQKPSFDLKNTGNYSFDFILRADSFGSLEVIKEKLNSFDEINIVKSGIGEPTAGDVELASATGANILLFNVRLAPNIVKKAESIGVNFFSYSLIYELLDEIEDLITNLRIKQEKEAKKVGEARIVEVFTKAGKKIAGLKVISGRIDKDLVVEVIRGKKNIGESKISSLYKKTKAIDVVKKGESCGMILSDSIDFTKGDIVKLYSL